MVFPITVFKSVSLVLIVAIVGSAMKDIVWFTNIHHGEISAVDEHMSWLILLCVYIVSAGGEDLLRDGINDSRTAIHAVVVTAITYENLLVFAIRLVVEDRDTECAFPVIQLPGLQLERSRFEMAAISSDHFKACLLIDYHPAVSSQIFEVDRSKPIHVQVGWHQAPSAEDSIFAIHIAAYHVIV